MKIYQLNKKRCYSYIILSKLSLEEPTLWKNPFNNRIVTRKYTLGRHNLKNHELGFRII